MGEILLTRGQFLQLGAVFAAELALAACGVKSNTPSEESLPLFPIREAEPSREPDWWQNPEIIAMGLLVAGDDIETAQFVNGFRLKDQVTLMHSGSEARIWRVVKPAREGFAVYFDPEKKEWLKVAVSKGRETLLEKSIQAMQTSLEVSGRSEEVVLETVEIGGRTYKAMRVAHLDPTLDVLREAKRISNEELTKVLEMAFEKSLRLLEKGYLWADANWKNILVGKDSAGRLRVTLIDFTNSRLIRPNGIASDISKFILWRGFADRARVLGIFFDGAKILFDTTGTRLADVLDHVKVRKYYAFVIDGSLGEIKLAEGAAEVASTTRVAERIQTAESFIGQARIRMQWIKKIPDWLKQISAGTGTAVKWLGKTADFAIIYSLTGSFIDSLDPRSWSRVNILLDGNKPQAVPVSDLYVETLQHKQARGARAMPEWQAFIERQNAAIRAYIDWGFSPEEAQGFTQPDFQRVIHESFLPRKVSVAAPFPADTSLNVSALLLDGEQYCAVWEDPQKETSDGFAELGRNLRILLLLHLDSEKRRWVLASENPDMLAPQKGTICPAGFPIGFLPIDVIGSGEISVMFNERKGTITFWKSK